MSYLLDHLNPQQREAVEATEGPLLILAGAGSGKTRVITYRIAYLIESRSKAPESILAVTFTNKAADQMKERVAALLGRNREGNSDGATSSPGWPYISTFHSFCAHVLRRAADRLGYTRDFSIYDEDDQQRAVKAAVEELGLGDQLASPQSILSRISAAKNRGLRPRDLYREAADSSKEKVALVFDRYEKKLRQANALDFDDLLLKTVELFDQHPEVREEYNRRFQYILVDEYQDTNRPQYQLIRHLTASHQNLCVVGDEDQSIYRWRGADIQNILSFEKDYPQTRLIRLEQNYRSTQPILDAASAVVGHNVARIGKALRAERKEGEAPGVYEAANAEEEALFVASAISSNASSSADETLGVLYRTNAQSRILEEAMRGTSVRYRVVGASSFYKRTEVRDAVAYARLACNRRDDAALLRIVNSPPRGIGDATVKAVQESARQQNLSLWEALQHELANNDLPARALKAMDGFRQTILALVAERERAALSGFFRKVLERSRLLDALREENTPESAGRVENLEELVNAAADAEQRGETLVEFLARVALVSEADDFDERAPVTLMTLHSAKGLEFSTVFLVGLEEGLFPHKLSLDDDAALEEERRLCYVGMTRAKNRLVLSWARARRSYGREAFEATRASRFLKEIPAELLQPLNVVTLSPKVRTTWENAVNSVRDVQGLLRQRGLATERHGRWKLGSQVRHPKYGLGTVIRCEGDGEDTKLTVSFPGYGTKKLVERYASLEKA